MESLLLTDYNISTKLFNSVQNTEENRKKKILYFLSVADSFKQ